jgi:hypothetical protein
LPASVLYEMPLSPGISNQAINTEKKHIETWL